MFTFIPKKSMSDARYIKLLEERLAAAEERIKAVEERVAAAEERIEATEQSTLDSNQRIAELDQQVVELRAIVKAAMEELEGPASNLH